MEKYRKSLRLQSALIAAGILCLILVQVLAFCGVFTPAVSDAHWSSMYAGFIAGAAFGVTVLFIVGLVKNLRALRSEARSAPRRRAAPTAFRSSCCCSPSS